MLRVCKNEAQLEKQELPVQSILDFLSKIFDLPTERLNGLIALAGIGLATFAIYVVYAMAK